MDSSIRIFTAIDAALERRPGVPHDQMPPAVVGQAHWTEPEPQPLTPGVVKDAQRAVFSATFGTGQVPRGVSGVMRRVAYGIPDYRAKRWALLLLADRVDSFESRLGELATNPATWIALGVAAGAGVVARAARTKRRSFF